MLSGGIREGQLTELVGESSSGKTQLCLSIALRTALRNEGVIYLDTTASFSASRLVEMHRHEPLESQQARAAAAPCRRSAGDSILPLPDLRRLWSAVR